MDRKRIAEIKKLQMKKYRDESGLFIVEGRKSVSDLLNSQMKTVAVAANAEWIEKYGASIPKEIEMIETNCKEMERISALKNPQEVLAIATIPHFDIATIKSTTPILVLDGISDPGNMGTIMRTADWFGITDIVCSNDTVEFANPKVVQASMGSFCRVKVFYTNLCNFLKTQRSRNIYGTFLEGTPIQKTIFKENDIIVIGNEGNGISEEVAALVNSRIHIPANQGNGAESLNAAISTGIVLYQYRQSL